VSVTWGDRFPVRGAAAGAAPHSAPAAPTPRTRNTAPSSGGGRTTGRLEEKLGYRPGLDGLRALAVLVVIGSHVDVPLLDKRGMFGVAMFFTLSGFLITRLLLENARLGEFYRRRAARLLPGLFLVLAAVAVMRSLRGAPWHFDVGAVLTYQANRFGGELGELNHTWSLAVEEHFYFVWPLVVVLVGRWLRQVAMCAVGVSFAVTLLLWNNTGAMYHRSDARAHLILLGCLVALTAPRVRRWCAPLGWCLIVVSMVEPDGSVGVLAMTATAIGTALVLPRLVETPGWLGSKPLVAIGQRSYGLYLWNLPVLYWVDGMVPRVAATFVLACVSYRWVEQPARQWLNRLSERRVFPQLHLADSRVP
jgi:peptidoglycan/LPS O-acetylase OafA/YrhL